MKGFIPWAKKFELYLKVDRWGKTANCNTEWYHR